MKIFSANGFPVILIGFLILTINPLLPQNADYLDSILDQVEDEELENSEWLEHLWELREKPLNLNTATVSELSRIIFIPPIIAQQIIGYRRKNGDYSRLSDLRKVEGITPELYEALLPFVTIEKPDTKGHYIYRLKVRLETPERSGYLSGRYGNRYFLQHRGIFQINPNFSGGFLVEKDAGEDNYSDYTSFHVQYYYRKTGTTILAGDYHGKIGNGLVLWSAYGKPLTPATIPMFSENDILFSGNRSSNEFHFFRGIKISNQIFNDSRISIFYSRRRLDATLTGDSSSISSYYLSGLHRTPNEKSKSGISAEHGLGVTLQSPYKQFDIQGAFLLTRSNFYYKSLAKEERYLSFSYHTRLENIRPSAEIVLQNEKYAAFQQDLFLQSGSMRYQVSAYYYHPQYFSLWGRSFASFSSPPGNRLGGALVFNYRFSGKTKIGGFVHFYRKARDPELLTYLNRDYQLELLQKFGTQLFKIQYRQRYRNPGTETVFVTDKQFNSAKFAHYLKVSKYLKFQNRLELRWTKPLQNSRRSYGMSLFHHIEWNMPEKYKIILRWTSFDVPDFDLRIYEYEPDLPGSIRSVLLNDRGYKFLFLIRREVKDMFQFDLKYSQRFFPDLKTVGSGDDQFETNRIHDFRFSIIWKY